MKIVVYGKPDCPYCDKIKDLLKLKGILYSYKDISKEKYFEEFIAHRLKTVPAVFIDGVFKGGFTETKDLF